MSPARMSASLAMALAALAAPGALATPAAAAEPVTLRVFAAASLTGAFKELADAFERAHPGVTVQLNLAGSQQLVTQLEQGAKADLLATADDRWMERAGSAGLLADSAVTIARNQLVVVAPNAGLWRVKSLRDLGRNGVKLIIGADAVPVGHYTRTVLENLDRDASLGERYSARVLANVVSQEENVKSIVNKLRLGEADAGIVYQSDVSRTGTQQLRTLSIPPQSNVIASYPMAVLRGAARPEDAQAFLSLVRSEAGQKILAKWRFLPAAAK